MVQCPTPVLWINDGNKAGRSMTVALVPVLLTSSENARVLEIGRAEFMSVSDQWCKYFISPVFIYFCSVFTLAYVPEC